MSVEIITLKKYRKMINSKKLDKYENLPVIYSQDDEGNNYDRVLMAPGGVMKEVEVHNDSGVTFDKAICIN